MKAELEQLLKSPSVRYFSIDKDNEIVTIIMVLGDKEFEFTGLNSDYKIAIEECLDDFRANKISDQREIFYES